MSEEVEAEAEVKTYEFDAPFQGKIAALALRDTNFLQGTEGLLKPEYMASGVEGALVDVALRHYGKYRQAPSITILPMLVKEAIAEKRIRSDMVGEIKGALRAVLKADLSDREFVTDKVSEFAKQRAVEAAIMSSVGYLDKGDYAGIERVMKEAMNVGAFDDSGAYDYYGSIDARTAEREAIASGAKVLRGVSSGYEALDECLYWKGWGYQELAVLMGAAKSGKSLGLWDFAKNATFAISPKTGRPCNVIGFSLEMSPDIIAARIDANISDTATRILGARPHDVAAKIKAAEARAGLFKIHGFPTGTLKASGIRRVLDRYRAQGIIFDFCVVDYGDIMAPEHYVDSAVENSKSIFVDLRAIMQIYDMAGMTGTQTNREGAKAGTAKATDVAEDFNKIRIADLVLSINAKDEEKAISEARIYWAAARNSEDGFTLRVRQDREKGKFITKILGKEK